MALVDTLAETLRLAWETAKAFHGREVTFDYGTGTVQLVAVKTRPNAQAVGTDGETIVESYAWDFLVEPADLIVGGTFIEPSEGFEITTEDGKKFRLIPGDSGNLVWRYSDQHKTFIRCFTESVN